MKLGAIFGRTFFLMTVAMDIVAAITTIRLRTFLPPTPAPTQSFTQPPFLWTPPPYPWTTRPHLQTQGVAAPFDLNPYRTTIPSTYPPQRRVIIECPQGFEQISTPCSSLDNAPSWSGCHAVALKMMHRFSVDGFQSCLDAVATIREYLGPTVDGNETTALRYPVATVEWWAMINRTNADLLQNEIEDVLETELNNLWSSRCADFIEFEVTCSLEGDRNNSMSTSVPSSNCSEEWFSGHPDDFTPVWQNGSFLLFFNGTFINPYWWSDRTTYDVVESFEDSRQDKTRGIRVCGTRKAMINCAAVLSDGEYSLRDGGNSTIIIYNGTEYTDEMFEYMSNNSVRICITHDNFSTTVAQESEKSPNGSSVNVQLIYGHILFAISTLCLILLIITYSIFPDLRNVQGCAILSFAISLLISQICLQYIAPYTPRTTAPCQGVAVVSHFTLLCAFGWMTLLAFDLCRSFQGTQRPARHEPANRLKRYTRYSLVGWGIPLLLVIVALGLHFTENNVLPLEYGSGRNCWVYPVFANIVFFIGPVVLSLTANIVLFIITVINICRTTKITRAALHQDRSHAHALTELLIYFKISCLMGFSWLFALVASAGTKPALWYLFITVNGLQGISVFLSFGVNARVRKMWGKTFKSGGSSTNTSSSGKTKKTKTSSV